MDKIIGFIGCGNMGKAMIGGIVKANLLPITNIIVSDINEQSLNEVKVKYNVKVVSDNLGVVNEANVLILAVKPNMYVNVINEIKDFVKDDTIIIAIAAGITLNQLEVLFNRKLKFIKAMPNTPALVLEGMSAIAHNDFISKTDLDFVLNIFKSFGEVEVVSENLMDAVTAVSGSAPAYIFMLIEAMADGAVLLGMSRKEAYRFASQTVLGSAKMVLETNMHPGILKDMVCSPGGTTIEAVATLEEKGFRSAVISAMKSCYEKSKEMSK